MVLLALVVIETAPLGRMRPVSFQTRCQRPLEDRQYSARASGSHRITAHQWVGWQPQRRADAGNQVRDDG
jgi:hypothetical protein